jgi:hypothetical protein
MLTVTIDEPVTMQDTAEALEQKSATITRSLPRQRRLHI